MKRLFFLTLIIGLFGNLQLNGQVNNNFKLHLLGQSDGQKIQLRWTVAEPEIWQEGNANGYSIERYTTHNNGIRLSALDIQNSRITLANSLTPLSESEWSSQFPNNNFAQVGKGTLYEEDVTVQVTNNPTLADAVNAVDSKDSRFLFALFAAEQDFEVAKGMALAFEDAAIEANMTYEYIVKLNSTNPVFTNIHNGIRVKTNDIPQLPAPELVQGEGSDHTIFLEWNMDSTRNHYSSYDVERSIDGQNFTKLNDLPFIFAVEGDDQPKQGIYKDSIPENNVPYYYRIKGRTPFGTNGPASNVIVAEGKEPRVNLFLKLEPDGITETNVKFHWNNFDENLAAEVQSFSVLRSTKSNDDFVAVNDSPIEATARAYNDDSPLPTAYYKLQAIDQNGYEYISPAILIQLEDSTPPVVPTGLSGTFIGAHKVQLKWAANTEEDLKGYRLLVSNKGDANFVQFTTTDVVDTSFVYDVDPTFMTDSIYFKVFASDNRGNYSDHSEPLGLSRPDVMGPSNPVLYKVTPTPEGIQVGWRFSESGDRKTHYLERKAKNTPTWEQVLEINQSQEQDYHENLTPDDFTATCFLDTTILDRGTYVYRLVAEDESGNLSSSEIVEVRPYDSGQRGEITDFASSIVCFAPNGVPEQAAFDALEELIAYYNSSGNIDYAQLQILHETGTITPEEYEELQSAAPRKVVFYLSIRKAELWGDSLVAEVTLDWIYSAADQLVDFQLFRSAESSAMQLYKTLTLEELSTFSFVDKDVKAGRRYFYQIMARHQGGGYSERSDILMVRIPEY